MRRISVFNPDALPEEDLPIIYGFNNGGPLGQLKAQLIAADGVAFFSAICSGEGFMLDELGVIEGTRPDFHQRFQTHYPSGYKMEFVPSTIMDKHEGLQKAFKKNDKLGTDKVHLNVQAPDFPTKKILHL